jgi:hypothetical protein
LKEPDHLNIMSIMGGAFPEATILFLSSIKKSLQCLRAKIFVEISGYNLTSLRRSSISDASVFRYIKRYYRKRLTRTIFCVCCNEPHNRIETETKIRI